MAVRGLKRPGLESASFDLERGEAIHVSGPSGAGKTLLLRAIADLDPSNGDVRLEGVARADIAPPLWRRQVRYVAAEPAWWADRVRDHFVHAARASELAVDLGLDAAVLDRIVAGLSTGERQRLALLRALENEPKVLLLDEPTAALDDESTGRVAELLSRTLRAHTGLIVVSHDTALVDVIGGRGFTMANGRLARA